MGESRTIGYAVVGLGRIAQAAVLPAFANAARNSRLAALVSGDEAKRDTLTRRYRLPADAAYDYDAYDDCLRRDDVDAVYIAVPNHLHREFAVRAAERGVHVLCEKPMAVTTAECREMIEACDRNGVRLMVAYRLHFDPANLEAVRLVQDGAIGEPRVFNAAFTLQVGKDDVRLMPSEQGGGPLYDIGVYCINAARYLFRAEPEAVWATATTSGRGRFRDSEEAMSCVLRFPGDRLAAFTCSFGAAPVCVFELVGGDAALRMSNAFEYRGDRTLTLPDGRTRVIGEGDQFAPQLLHFSDCIIADRAPEPDGREGLVDVTIIRAFYESIETGRMVEVDVARDRRPVPDQAMHIPPVEQPELVRADETSG